MSVSVSSETEISPKSDYPKFPKVALSFRNIQIFRILDVSENFRKLVTIPGFAERRAPGSLELGRPETRNLLDGTSVARVQGGCWVETDEGRATQAGALETDEGRATQAGALTAREPLPIQQLGD